MLISYLQREKKPDIVEPRACCFNILVRCPFDACANVKLLSLSSHTIRIASTKLQVSRRPRDLGKMIYIIVESAFRLVGKD